MAVKGSKIIVISSTVAEKHYVGGGSPHQWYSSESDDWIGAAAGCGDAQSNCSEEEELSTLCYLPTYA